MNYVPNAYSHLYELSHNGPIGSFYLIRPTLLRVSTSDIVRMYLFLPWFCYQLSLDIRICTSNDLLSMPGYYRFISKWRHNETCNKCPPNLALKPLQMYKLRQWLYIEIMASTAHRETQPTYISKWKIKVWSKSRISLSQKQVGTERRIIAVRRRTTQ